MRSKRTRGPVVVGDRFGRLVVVASTGSEDARVDSIPVADILKTELDDLRASLNGIGGSTRYTLRCDCGVRIVATSQNVKTRTSCGDYCALVIANKKDAPGETKKCGAKNYAGRAGVFAVGESIDLKGRPGLAAFCEDPITRYVVVYMDGSRAFADSFDEAKAMNADVAEVDSLGAESFVGPESRAA